MSADKINDGGPAFPGLNAEFTGISSEGRERYEIQPSGGMTLLDYFVAHAPAEPQAWFAPVMPPRPEELPNTDGDHSKEELYERDFARRTWESERRKQCYVQWPAAWAREMLKARSA